MSIGELVVIKCGTGLVVESTLQNKYRQKSMSAMDSDNGDSIFVTQDKFSLDKSLSYDTDSAIDVVFFLRKPGKFRFNCQN